MVCSSCCGTRFWKIVSTDSAPADASELIRRLLSPARFFFRPMPSWLPPGRYTCFSILLLQQEIPLWQEKHKDKVQPTGSGDTDTTASTGGKARQRFMPATPAPAAPVTAAPSGSCKSHCAWYGTEVSPSLSENSGRSRAPTRSGVCSVTEDGSMTMFDSGGNLLILELACCVDSVIQNASIGSLDPVTLEFMPV